MGVIPYILLTHSTVRPTAQVAFHLFPVSLVPYLMLLFVWLLALLFMQCKQLFQLGRWVPYTLIGIAVVILSISFSELTQVQIDL